MFQGVVGINLDAKGRLAIPTKHRDRLLSNSETKLVLTSHPHRCLLLYPSASWAPIRAQIMSFSSFDPQLSLWKRLLVGFAEEMELDNSGRILVSPSQRQFAGLEKKVMLVGQGSHFELWSESSWEKQISQFDEGPANPPAGMENFAL